MIRSIARAFLMLVVLVATGCVHEFSHMATHELSSGPEQEVDVVWVRVGADILYRCTSYHNAPMCLRAQFR